MKEDAIFDKYLEKDDDGKQKPDDVITQRYISSRRARASEIAGREC